MQNFDPSREAAIRTNLQAVVEGQRRARRRWLPLAAIGVGGLLAGAGVSAAIATGLGAAPIGYPNPTPGVTNSAIVPRDAGVEAPAGVIPGNNIQTKVGQPDIEAFSSSGQVNLDPPAGATNVSVTLIFQCEADTTITWGLSADGNNPSSSCGSRDVGVQQKTGYDFQISKNPVFHVQIAGTAAIQVKFQYLHEVPTRWGVNARGETYGVSKPGFGDPDLIAVQATNGRQGYVRATDLAAATGQPDQATSPSQAAQSQQALSGTSVAIAVFTSDGTTAVGKFLVER